jgi:hypothetical protein
MSKISELQEEFESLIKQLERLKSINDITSANSMKAEMTIDEIQKFIVATEKLLTAIKDDYEKKKKDFSSSEKALEAAVVKLNHGIAEQAEKFETITSSNSKIFVKELDILKKDWNTRVENYMHQIKDVKKKIETEVMDYSRSTTGQVRSLSQSIFEQLEDESKAKSKDIGVLRIKVDELNESIKREILENKELTKFEINNLNNQIQFLKSLLIGIGSVLFLGLAFLIFRDVLT